MKTGRDCTVSLEKVDNKVGGSYNWKKIYEACDEWGWHLGPWMRTYSQ